MIDISLFGLLAGVSAAVGYVRAVSSYRSSLVVAVAAVAAGVLAVVAIGIAAILFAASGHCFE